MNTLSHTWVVIQSLLCKYKTHGASEKQTAAARHAQLVYHLEVGLPHIIWFPWNQYSADYFHFNAYNRLSILTFHRLTHQFLYIYIYLMFSCKRSRTSCSNLITPLFYISYIG